MSDKKHRVTEYNINDIFINRWSRRAYTGEAIDDQTLFSLFEAARWAPSANNSQPWRFIYVKNGSEYWDPLLKAANERNQRWAAKAGVLIVLISKKTQIRPDETEPTPLRNHSLDAGAAWLSLALQASYSGLSTRAMGGFDREQAKTLLGIPDGYQLEILIAVGKPADRKNLDAELQDKEQPHRADPLSNLLPKGASLLANKKYFQRIKKRPV